MLDVKSNDGLKNMAFNSASVVVITKNSALTIKRCLNSVFEQTRKPDEVVVVDGSSTDGTINILKEYPVKLIVEPGLGFGYARNLGVKSASGDIIFFIDSDCHADPMWIMKAIKHFADERVAAVTGPTLLWNVECGVARFLAWVGGRMEFPKEKRFVRIAPTMNLAVRKKAILEVGGFDESLIRCEDTDLTYKLAKRYAIVYEPEAIVWFKGSTSVKTASMKCLRHFIGVGQLFAKHGFDKSFLRWNLPIRGATWVIAIASAFTAPWYVTAAALSLLFLEFVHKTVKLYRRCRDKCVAYYAIFFTLWSWLSFAVLYGLALGLKNRKRLAPLRAALERER